MPAAEASVRAALGKEFSIRGGKLISFLTSGEYDILGFDPRGVADSSSVQCSENSSLHAAAAMSKISPPNALGSTTLVSKFTSYQELMAKSCGKWSDDPPLYISNAYTARNMDLILGLDGFSVQALPSKPVERFAGAWNPTTKNKVLLIGNTFDPVTPLKSAKLAESLMGGNRRLLTHNAYGHCSMGQFGFCSRILHEWVVPCSRNCLQLDQEEEKSIFAANDPFCR
ncbi:hypothetical protein BJ741DRAFT_672966 [Chytriomyces cf. hyalinus JEL632]|nr:hypothetical protein BJ741DRAFT_672966 [Chytriomyces cf. hyalinus JEL632]